MLVTKKLKCTALSDARPSDPEQAVSSAPRHRAPALSAGVRAARNVSAKLHTHVILERSHTVTSDDHLCTLAVPFVISLIWDFQQLDLFYLAQERVLIAPLPGAS